MLRANRDALMNVLETFAHDPLVEWIKKDNEGHKLLARCERRLRGEVRLLGGGFQQTRRKTQEDIQTRRGAILTST